MTEPYSRNINQNNEANIGFLLSQPIDFYVFKSVYSNLPNAEFIIDRSSFIDRKTLDNLLTIVSNRKVYWRLYEPSNSATSREEFYNKYGLLVSTKYLQVLRASYNQDKKKVRIMADHSDIIKNFGLWNAYFDLILCPGDFSHSVLSMYYNTVITGNPLFDDWILHGVTDDDTASDIKSTLDPSKKTILCVDLDAKYLLHKLFSSLHQLTNEYNFIIWSKPNRYFDNEARGQLLSAFASNKNIYFAPDTADIMSLFNSAYLLVVEATGFLFETLIAKKPTIIIENPYAKLQAGIYMSPPFEIAIEKIGPVLKETREIKNDPVPQQIQFSKIKEIIIEAFHTNKQYSESRNEIFIRFFTANDGKSGKRSAEKLIQLLYQQYNKPSFLRKSVDIYERDLWNSLELKNKIPKEPGETKRGLREAGRRYKEIKRQPFVSKIMSILDDFF